MLRLFYPVSFFIHYFPWLPINCKYFADYEALSRHLSGPVSPPFVVEWVRGGGGRLGAQNNKLGDPSFYRGGTADVFSGPMKRYL